MDALRLKIEPMTLARTADPWLGDKRPYRYQAHAYRRIEQALRANETLCVFLVTPTGSGKTLASYAYAINHKMSVLGAYPTNALIRDQEQALREWLDPTDEYQMIRLDSSELDRWQALQQLKRHAEALERILNWQTSVLTNPDILFYIFFGLYGGQGESLGRRLFARLAQYRFFVFDEFHLYNVKQMADTCYLIAALHAINPDRGRVFVFASATPESQAGHWLAKRLGLPVETIESQDVRADDTRTVAWPVDLTVLPAQLRKWKGTEKLFEYLPRIESFMQEYAQARLLVILDSVAAAMATAKGLREAFPDKSVGEIHGFSSTQERESAARQPITVGTSTIEVGIDFKGDKAKDILVYEARTASQFIQRFGRLGRHHKSLSIPNRAVALVPDHVFHYLGTQVKEEQSLTRNALYRLVEDAYEKPEAFAGYLHEHAPAELQGARLQARSLFQPPEREEIDGNLARAITRLTDRKEKQIWAMYRSYQEQEILAPLLTFRNSGLQAAILDQRPNVEGFPVKRYDLMFLLRRGEFEEISKKQYLEFLDRLPDRWEEETQRERRFSDLVGRSSSDLLGVYGYFRLHTMREEPRRVSFSVPYRAVRGHKAQVMPLRGLQLQTEPYTPLVRVNRFLRRKRIVAWFVDRHPAAVRYGRHLPPLFPIYYLEVGGPGAGRPWTLALNQAAFFVGSLPWWREARDDDALIY